MLFRVAVQHLSLLFGMLIVLVVGVLDERDGFRDDGDVLNALILNSRSRDAFILCLCKLLCSVLF